MALGSAESLKPLIRSSESVMTPGGRRMLLRAKDLLPLWTLLLLILPSHLPHFDTSLTASFIPSLLPSVTRFHLCLRQFFFKNRSLQCSTSCSRTHTSWRRREEAVKQVISLSVWFRHRHLNPWSEGTLKALTSWLLRLSSDVHMNEPLLSFVSSHAFKLLLLLPLPPLSLSICPCSASWSQKTCE